MPGSKPRASSACPSSAAVGRSSHTNSNESSAMASFASATNASTSPAPTPGRTVPRPRPVDVGRLNHPNRLSTRSYPMSGVGSRYQRATSTTSSSWAGWRAIPRVSTHAPRRVVRDSVPRVHQWPSRLRKDRSARASRCDSGLAGTGSLRSGGTGRLCLGGAAQLRARTQRSRCSRAHLCRPRRCGGVARPACPGAADLQAVTRLGW